MVEPEFTAEMEGQLDAIASGNKIEPYLINWNETYFAPALDVAYRSLGSKSATSSGNRRVELTEIHCPKCSAVMQKIPCRSQKLQADHFLKCSKDL